MWTFFFSLSSLSWSEQEISWCCCEFSSQMTYIMPFQTIIRGKRIEINISWCEIRWHFCLFVGSVTRHLSFFFACIQKVAIYQRKVRPTYVVRLKYIVCLFVEFVQSMREFHGRREVFHANKYVHLSSVHCFNIAQVLRICVNFFLSWHGKWASFPQRNNNKICTIFSFFLSLSLSFSLFLCRCIINVTVVMVAMAFFFCASPHRRGQIWIRLKSVVINSRENLIK